MVDVVRRSLRISIVEGCLHAVMVGASESYLGALAVQLGHKDLSLALLVTLPLLVGSVAQFSSSLLVRWFGSRRRAVVMLAALQAAVHLGLLAIAFFEVRSFVALLVVKCLYWAFGTAIGPAWNSWMGSLTKDIDRARYFALRSAFVQLALLVAYAAAGFALEHGRQMQALMPMFAILYGVAMLARTASTYALATQADPVPDDERHHDPILPRLASALGHSRLRIALFCGVFHFGACIAIPFFTPYMFKDLQLDFIHFMLLTAIATLVKAICFPLWGRVAAKIGMRVPLFVATLCAALVALLWADVTSFAALCAVQALSGLSWAGLEFTAFQLLMRSSSDEHRVAFFALSTSFTSLMQVSGSLVGAALLWLFPYGYEVTFVVSGLGRGLSSLLLLAPIVAILSRGPLPRVFFRVISMRPEGGSVKTPIIPDDPRGA